MGDLDDYGDETFRGYRLLEEMIYTMLKSGERQARLPKANIPLDYSVFPFEIVRFDKVVKVLDMVSKDDVHRRVRSFSIVDQNTGIPHRFIFRDSFDGKYLEFEIVDEGI